MITLLKIAVNRQLMEEEWPTTFQDNEQQPEALAYAFFRDALIAAEDEREERQAWRKPGSPANQAEWEKENTIVWKKSG